MEMTARRQEMFGLVEQYRSSGLSSKAFCERQGLKATTFGWWVSEYRRAHGPSVAVERAPSFVAVAGSVTSEAVEYRYADGATVRIPAALGAGQIGQILSQVRGTRCLR